MNHLVKDNLRQIESLIPDNVRLVAVSKKVSVKVMQSVYESGIRDFGENRLQEVLDKQAQLKHIPDICWHFIGHLQTNKAKKAVESCDWIHSVDSLKIAQRLDYYAQKAIESKAITNSPQVCLQIKVLPDENKYGWETQQLWQDLPQLVQLKNLNVRGLMSILPLGLSKQQTLDAFQKVAQLAQDIRQKDFFTSDFDQLSMGMSADYLQAIEAGATMIRLGSMIFKERLN